MSRHTADGIDDVVVALVDVAAADAVEPKVKAATAAGATAAGLIAPVVLWLLSRYLFDGVELPLPVATAVTTCITGLCTFAAGYYARHVDRARATP